MTFPLSRTIPSLAAAILPWAASAQDVDCTAEERREYRLTGWAFAIPFEPGSEPPRIDCVAPAEWFVHEAGWHTMDGGMQLTPDARGEPPRSHARRRSTSGTRACGTRTSGGARTACPRSRSTIHGTQATASSFRATPSSG
jgi:hypothetical protein